MEPASIGEKPAARALSPYTSPKPAAETMIPTESMRSRRRDSPIVITGATPIVACRAAPTESAQERLAAGPVAHDIQGVEVPGIAGRVQDPGTALGRALPRPPAIARV